MKKWLPTFAALVGSILIAHHTGMKFWQWAGVWVCLDVMIARTEQIA